MNLSRNTSPLSLQLIEAMSTDPNSTPALRKFHAAQLVKLRASVKPERVERPSPFSRFADKLKSEP
jgi:hypothetical protein